MKLTTLSLSAVIALGMVSTAHARLATVPKPNTARPGSTLRAPGAGAAGGAVVTAPELNILARAQAAGLSPTAIRPLQNRILFAKAPNGQDMGLTEADIAANIEAAVGELRQAGQVDVADQLFQVAQGGLTSLVEAGQANVGKVGSAVLFASDSLVNLVSKSADEPNCDLLARARSTPSASTIPSDRDAAAQKFDVEQKLNGQIDRTIHVAAVYDMPAQEAQEVSAGILEMATSADNGADVQVANGASLILSAWEEAAGEVYNNEVTETTARQGAGGTLTRKVWQNTTHRLRDVYGVPGEVVNELDGSCRIHFAGPTAANL